MSEADTPHAQTAKTSNVVHDCERRRALFDQFLRCLDREENLIHYRLSWGLQWNGACFAALLILQNSTQIAMPYKSICIIFLSIFGSIASVLSSIGVRAAHAQTAYLIDRINLRLGIVAHDWEQAEFIRPYGDNSVHTSARKVSALFPTGFLVMWIFVFFFSMKSILS
jgi:hypothetical protein